MRARRLTLRSVDGRENDEARREVGETWTVQLMRAAPFATPVLRSSRDNKKHALRQKQLARLERVAGDLIAFNGLTASVLGLLAGVDAGQVAANKENPAATLAVALSCARAKANAEDVMVMERDLRALVSKARVCAAGLGRCRGVHPPPPARPPQLASAKIIGEGDGIDFVDWIKRKADSAGARARAA